MRQGLSVLADTKGHRLHSVPPTVDTKYECGVTTEKINRGIMTSFFLLQRKSREMTSLSTWEDGMVLAWKSHLRCVFSESFVNDNKP